MTQTWRLAVLCVALLQGALTVSAADFSAAQAEAARDGLQEALDQALAKVLGPLEQVDGQPYIQLSQKTVLLVPVETVKRGYNVKIAGLNTLRRDGTFGVDPIVSGKPVNFTVPLKADHPQITGLFERKVGGVGGEGNFTTTIGVLRLEADGTATVTADACTFAVTGVREVEVDQVDSTVEGANVLNTLLASKVTKAVNERKMGVGPPLYAALLAKLQEGPKDCTASVRDRLRAVPATAAAA